MDEENLELNPRKTIPVPKKTFDQFCAEFPTIRDVIQTKEWHEIYSNYFSFTNAELDLDPNETREDLELLTEEQQMTEIIKCFNNFPYFCHRYIKISHPMRGLIPFRMFSYQRKVVESYAQNRFNILSKFRQGGLTTVSVLWALWRCMFQTDQQIMVLSKTDREAISAGEIVKNAMEYLPEWMKPKMDKANEHEKQFKETNSNLRFYTPEAARGKSITVLIIDEAAFVKDMKEHWKAMYPVIATGGSCIVVSTVNGIGNWYEETYKDAENKKNPFHIIEIDYWEHPEYNNPKWVSDNKANLGEKGWRQEVLRSFLGSGKTFIDTAIITELDQSTKDIEPQRVMFDKWLNKNEKREDSLNGALHIWKEPVDGREYIIGVDCAEGVGEENDNSCFQIIDSSTQEQVAEFYSNTIQPHVFSQILHQIGIFYNNALITIENLGAGTAVLSSLQNTLNYENLYYELGKAQTPGIKTKKNNRPVYMETLQSKLTNKEVKINSRRFVKELKTFLFNATTKKAEASRGKHDDAILALSMALYIRDSQVREMPVGSSQVEEPKIFQSSTYKEIMEEIQKGAPEEWMEEELDVVNPNSNSDVLLGIDFDIKRKNDKLLKEFGW